MAEEYYIRNSEADTARGPFNIEQLSTLAEAGQVSRDTYFFSEELDAWLPIASNEALRLKIFPEKKKISLRSGANPAIDRLNKAADPQDAIKVEDMLAAAEGKTEETRFLKERQERMDRAASIAPTLMAITFLISAATFIYPHYPMVFEWIKDAHFAPLEWLEYPYLIVGAIDLILGLILLAHATDIYIVAQARALIGIGYFGYLYFAAGVDGGPENFWIALGSVAFGIGTFIVSITLNLRLMLLAGLVALGGVITNAWFLVVRALIEPAQ